MARKRIEVMPARQKYCPVSGAPPPMRLYERTPRETQRMHDARIKPVGNLSYPGDRSLAGDGKRVYEKGRKNQTRSSS